MKDTSKEESFLNDDSGGNEIIDTAAKDSSSLRSLLSNKCVLKYFVFYFLFEVGCTITVSFMTVYKAEWWGGCKTIHSANIKPNHCDLDYDDANFYGNLFQSIVGILALITSTFIGSLSDSIGRMPFLYLQVITTSAPYIAMLFTNNFWWYSSLLLLVGLNGSCFSDSPGFLAYFGDIVPSNQSALGYGLCYVIEGCSILIGISIGLIVSYFYDYYICFYIATTMYLLTAIYTFIFMKESLPKSKRKPFVTTSLNPFKSLLKIHKHKIVLWISIIIALISLPEAGVIDTGTTMFCDNLNSTDWQCNIINYLFTIGSCSGMIIGPILILPKLKKYFTNFKIMILMILLMAFSFIMMMAVTLIHLFNLSIICAYIIIPSSAFLLGLSMLSISTANSICSDYLLNNERGIGFGILFAFRGITFIIAPFGFAAIYSALKSLAFPCLAFVPAIIMVLIAFILSIYILKPILRNADENNIVYSYYNVNIEQKSLNVQDT